MSVPVYAFVYFFFSFLFFALCSLFFLCLFFVFLRMEVSMVSTLITKFQNVYFLQQIIIGILGIVTWVKLNKMTVSQKYYFGSSCSK